MKRFVYTSTILFAITFALWSCKEQDEKISSGYDIETAKIFSHLPADVLEPDAPIEFRFVQDMVNENEISQTTIPENVLEFDPGLDGKLTWKDSRTLTFTPDKILPAHKQFEGSVDVEKLFPEKFKGVDPIKFSFRVAGQEIASIDDGFEPVSSSDPKHVYYQATLTFTLRADLQILKKSLSLKQDNNSISFEVTAANENRIFTLRSAELNRRDREITYKLHINSEGLQLPLAFDRVITLPAARDMKVTSIKKDEGGDQPRMKIEFSDELSPEQDVSGFVRVEPQMQVTVKKVGNSVLVNGPFKYGETYMVVVDKGIRSRWATELKIPYNQKIVFEDLLPEIRFSRDGVLLPSSGKQKVAFMTVNVRKVHLKVMKVFESNIGQFLQMEQLDGSSGRSEQFDYYVNRVGVDVADTNLTISDQPNRWLQSELDLSPLIKPEFKGLLLLSLSFEKEDMIYDVNNDDESDEYGNYSSGHYRYGRPGSYWYMYNKARVYKPLILSDVGLTYKQEDGKAIIYATNLLDAKPLAHVNISLRTYQNQLIAEGMTNAQGIAEIDPVNENVFYVEGIYENRRSIIKCNSMAWNLSNFDIEGRELQKGGIKGFVYTERGVYRPGDTVNISLILRNEQGTFPENHPVTLEVINPRNQSILKTTNRKARDGFYIFRFSTKEEDPTGTYRLDFTAGSAKINSSVKIETVVPERIKIEAETTPDKITAQTHHLMLNVDAKYLFGNPASNLDTEIRATISPLKTSFPRYKKFIFSSEISSFQQVDDNITTAKLDANGKLTTRWQIPDLGQAPGKLLTRLNIRVLEKGGRSSRKQIIIPTDPFKHYVGLKRPDLDWGYAQTGNKVDVPVILVDNDGKSLPGRNLKYTIYRNESHWWWEYDSRDQFRMRYKSDNNTEVVEQGELISGTIAINLEFTPKESGQYLVEVNDAVPGGHSVAIFMDAWEWGSSPVSNQDAGTLVLKTDKENYNPGDKAHITFPVPANATILLTVEKGRQVLQSNWHYTEGDQKTMDIEIPITEVMLPTAYVTVSLLQPHAVTKNDRPLRTYGVVPLNVADPATVQNIRIDMADELKPDKSFDVHIQTGDSKATQFTVSVVDEGLLQLTNFKTPDPWKTFYSKEHLGVLTYDLYGYVIGATKGDIFRTFSIGGDEFETRAVQPEEDQKAKRFKPVCMFYGPAMTDGSGQSKISFKMPEYIGAVRVMVVSADGKRYGHAEKEVPVKSDLMVLPTLPRVLGPQDIIDIPVTVFAMKDKLGDITVNLKASGPVQVQGAGTQTVNFAKSGDKDVLFKVKVDAAIGVARISIEAKATNGAVSRYNTELQIRPSATQEYISENKQAGPGEKVDFNIPDRGLKGSNSSTLTIRRKPDMNFGKRLYWLIHYPYGCIEQTTSSVFPQLYLEKFIPPSTLAKADMDDNINRGIKRLQRFKMPAGSFTYWPGSSAYSDWGTNYAGHFLLEAKKKGYYVPDELLNDWLRFQRSRALTTLDNMTSRIYRLYLLALAGQPALGPMNLIRENSLSDLNNTQLWLLAAAYKLAAADNEAEAIARKAGTTVNDYREFSDTFGSKMRDKAIILEQLVLFNRMADADKLAGELAEVMRSKVWLSTQESAYMLMALTKYLEVLDSGNGGDLTGQIVFSGGRTENFKVTDKMFMLPVNTEFGQTVTVAVDGSSDIKRAYMTLDWSGTPLRSVQGDTQENLTLRVRWLDEMGMPINPSSIQQGKTFWGVYQVSFKSGKYQSVENLALTQILPAGWEIENMRLTDNASLPAWTQNYKMGQADYTDIRDDRISWFFGLSGWGGEKTFLVKITTVTAGEFYLPGAVFEAMYDSNYRATKKGMPVKVTPR